MKLPTLPKAMQARSQKTKSKNPRSNNKTKVEEEVGEAEVDVVKEEVAGNKRQPRQPAKAKRRSHE